MLAPHIAREVETALRDLQYGSVHLVVHDAQVVRIERVERISLPAAPKHHRIVDRKTYRPVAQPGGGLFAAQAGLTGSPEAIPDTHGRPTTSPEVRHGAQQEA